MSEDLLRAARDVFALEAKSLLRAGERVDAGFADAVGSILVAKGKLIVCGMGKSGIVGKKMAATFASTGTPSFFMHPGEAYHGDLGMVTSDDIFLAISNSGETEEVVKLIPFLKDNGNFLIALTGNPSSSLARAAHCHLHVGVDEEACPLNLAPTSSTTVTMAMGDALAVTLMKARGFKPENFARFHPGGSLGRRLLRRVEDEMVSENLPIVPESAGVLELLNAMTRSRLGVAIVKRGGGWALITDGDVRRAIETFENKVFSKNAGDLMTVDPQMVSVGTRIEDALALMDSKRITTLLVSEGAEVVGVFKK
ncbi:arabinose-5-phosphate isomerase [Parazoarcus communis]|uniref:Arabinose-5-phosphate isomerase n=1 Tax=Parazoarcus communis TaxID=41977 RepID=A0A2U8H975_9RHOO|nr:KpsF/GutQ family sugar-phosphate isomerase [Parazoarcus communis]AWI81666.1 arabinose-5-phosphate isomerase [Parazoarcus communis]